MVYLYVEDSNEGLYLMQLAQSLYNISKNDLRIDTFNGIFNIIEHVNNLTINSTDKVYYVYDNIEGNTDIPKNIKNVRSILNKKGLSDKITFMPVICCEYSLLTADHMEMFINKGELLHCIALKACNSDRITTETKELDLFKNIYDEIRDKQNKRLIARNKYKVAISKNDIEVTVTAEKLCKYIFKEAFKGELVTFNKHTKQCGACWEKNCCINNNKRVCNISKKSRNLLSDEKKKMLLQGAYFYEILSKICETEGLKYAKKYTITLNGVQLNNKIEQIYTKHNYNVKLCIENISTHFQEGYRKKKVIELCKKSNFDDYIIKEAMKALGRH